jgi:hypothetical protein
MTKLTAGLGAILAFGIFGSVWAQLDRDDAQKESMIQLTSGSMADGTVGEMSGHEQDRPPRDDCAQKYRECADRCTKKKTRDEQADCYYECSVTTTECMSRKRLP